MRQLLPPADGRDPLALYEDAARPLVGERPWLLANMVAGVDGRAAVEGRVGALSGTTDRSLFRRLRTLADVVLVGASTVRAEGYGTVRLSDESQAARVARGQAPFPCLAVVSGSLAIDWSLPAFATPTARPIVVTSEASDPARRGEAAAVAEVLVCGEATVDLPAALVGLRERGAAVVLTEGGPRLLAELVGADLLDELCLTIAPTLGGDPLAILSGAVDLQTLTLAHVLEEDGHLFLRYLTPR